jgi:Holliday junction resolvase RusA-like endonuclease
MIELRIDGKPTGKGRPRFVRATGRTFTDPQTEAAEARVERAWEDAGKPRLTGPIAFDLEIVVRRPKNHYRVNGMLTTAGAREPWPCRKPDADNALKLAMDALNGRAYRDDVDVVRVRVTRRWATSDEPEHTVIRVAAIATPAALTEAAA